MSIGRRPGGTRNGYKLARPRGAHSVLVACGSPRSFPERHVGPLATPRGFGHPKSTHALGHQRVSSSSGRGTPASSVPNPDSSFGLCATWRAVRRRRAGLRASEAGGGFEPGSGRPPTEACKAYPEVPRLARTTSEFRFAPAANARGGLRCRRRTGVSSTENPATPAAHDPFPQDGVSPGSGNVAGAVPQLGSNRSSLLLSVLSRLGTQGTRSS